jgi:hypothetical protein
VCCSLTQD